MWGWIWLSLDSLKQELLSLPLPLYFQLVYRNLFRDFKGYGGSRLIQAVYTVCKMNLTLGRVRTRKFTPTVVQGGRGWWMEPLSWVFDTFRQYFEIILS